MPDQQDPRYSSSLLETVNQTMSRPLIFFFNDPATPEIYTLSLHDALPISKAPPTSPAATTAPEASTPSLGASPRSEEHTSELQSQSNLVCRLLLEKKKNYKI